MKQIDFKKMALLVAVAIPAVSASAQVFTYNINGTEGSATYTQTVSGVTMSWLANPVESSNVYAFGVITSGPANGDLDLSAPGVLVSAFNFQFSQAVTILSYNVGVIAGPAAGTFSLSAPGSTTSSGNTLTTTGSHLINGGGFTIAANTTGTWTATIPSGTYPTIRGLTMVSAVPEPGEWATIGGVACALAAVAMRRRRAVPAV